MIERVNMNEVLKGDMSRDFWAAFALTGTAASKLCCLHFTLPLNIVFYTDTHWDTHDAGVDCFIRILTFSCFFVVCLAGLI